MEKKMIPAAWVRAEVFCRDGGQCTFWSGGRRCSEVKGLVVEPLDPVVMPEEDEPCAFGLFCRPHAELWALAVPDEEWAHA